MKKLITSALPYVNNVPHLGNIIGCVLSADVYARFCRSRGYETLYICGTDEYGTATETKAREEGLSPREVCDKYHEIHKSIYSDFNISFDIFGRTSTPEQTRIAQSIFSDLEQNNLIAEHTTQRTFCEKDSIFLADRFVEGTCPHCNFENARGDQCDSCGKLLEPENLISPRCKICGSAPVLRPTSHLYLELDKLQERLKQWAEKSWQEGKWTRNAVQTTIAWLEKGLQPRPITRDLTWGIPVPKTGYEKKVFYVWFDAPIGYISITSQAREDWPMWWQNPAGVQLYQFMAKDNIPFHTVIFPASLLGTGTSWTMLHHINSTEYLNYEDTKFSKSRNIGVFGDDVKETGISVDLWRFYLLANRPEKNDSSFAWNDFFEKVNSEFIDNIGNLTNRALVYLLKNFDGTIKDLPLSGEHREFADKCLVEFKKLTGYMEEVRIRESLRLILAVGNMGNKFFQDMVPWEKIKTDPDHALKTVSILAYLIKSLATALEPFVPEASGRILKMMNLDQGKWADIGIFDGLDGHRIGKPEILFQKLDKKQAEKFRKKFSGQQPDFKKFILKTGKITGIKKHPVSKHLYHLSIDCAENDDRSIVAGLAKHYSEKDLLGRSVIILANLVPAEIRGVESQGMVLLCEKRNKAELLNASSFKPGQTVSINNQAPVQAPEISIEDFKSAPFTVRDGVLLFDEQVCSIDNTPVTTEVLKNGKVR